MEPVERRISVWALLLRTGISITISLAVYLVAIIATWQQNGLYLVDRNIKRMTAQMELEQIDRAVREYRRLNGALPTTMEDLKSANGGEFANLFEDSGELRLDPWNRPYLYSVQDDEFNIVALGRDRTPGGKGLDADLTNAPSPSPDAFPPLDQFYGELAAPGMFRSCYVIAALAGIASFVLLSRPRRTHLTWLGDLLAIAATTIAAIWIAAVMASLHVPTGH